METVRVGMIGAGSMANAVHYPSLSEFGDVEIEAICDIDRNRLKETSDKYGVEKRYTDYKEMVSQNDLDAVYVIMPPHQLYDLVAHCLKKGLNTFIEKPPGVSLEQARNMARMAERNGCITMVAFNRRYIPLMRKVKSIVEERGPIIQCMATFYKNLIEEEHPYYQGAVDILTSDGIHAVDTLRWMGGEPSKISSDVESRYVGYGNSFNALIKFKNGCTGFLVTNWAVGKRVHTFEMHAKGVSAFVNPDESAVIYCDNKEGGQTISSKEAAGSDKFYKYYGYYDENRHFIDCVKEGRQPETNFTDAAKTMELVDAIYHSRT
ncbi:MAG: Gfo/Idh/MocA family oxidoreductase [Candidatus Brockarchaeota archaeon]|nr:Gfo/Idh/MocA family oxidoreductase [Candidatus Brockarchaeota archaeon]